ncbi:unnamed protein product, partial [Clonostachys chloroleuca]
MVIPTNASAIIALRCKDEVASVGEVKTKGAQIIPMGSNNGYRLFHANFETLGEHHIEVTLGDSRLAVLQYYCIKPIDHLIKDHSAFLVNQQLARTTRGFNGAFSQWDMATRKLIRKRKRIEFNNNVAARARQLNAMNTLASSLHGMTIQAVVGRHGWLGGWGSDLGLAPAAYLSEKCLNFPDQTEVSAIDYHIKNFLLGYLVNARDPYGQRTFQVYRWFDGHDGKPSDTGIWRAYNYTHVTNVFYNMYRIAQGYPRLETRYDALEYLEHAYQVLNAMYSKIPVPKPIGDAANTLGLMGESTVPEIARVLLQEGMTSQAETLKRYINKKVAYLKDVKYPFAPKMTIDTTGFESVFALSKVNGSDNLARKSQKASLASRGLQTLWYCYGSDNRMIGESYWNLGYETQLGSCQQQE